MKESDKLWKESTELRARIVVAVITDKAPTTHGRLVDICKEAQVETIASNLGPVTLALCFTELMYLKALLLHSDKQFEYEAALIKELIA